MANQFKVTANGLVLGVYAAESTQAARDFAAVDAGYQSEADMAARLGRGSELVAAIMMGMQVQARILHASGWVSTQAVSLPDRDTFEHWGDVLVPICSAMRDADASVAVVKIDCLGQDPYVWEGHATREHLAASAAPPINW